MSQARKEEQKRVWEMLITEGPLELPNWSQLSPEISLPKGHEPPSIDILWTANPSAMDELGQVMREAKGWQDESLQDLLL